MKKSLGIGILAAMTLSSIASVSPSVSRTINTLADVEAQKVLKQRTGTENQNPENRNVSSEEIQKLASVPFAKREKPFVYQSNPGTPPKFYGMNFVKSGTHKRTNI